MVLPGPVIPFVGCRYFQRGRVNLAARARFIWGDIWLPGRYDRGELSERFQFERIIQDFEARRVGRLVYRDRFRWDGPWTAGRGRLASRRSAGFGQPLCRRARSPERSPRRRPPCDVPLFRLDTGETCVRWCGPPGRHGRPGQDRSATGRELDRRSRRPALASRVERPCAEPLVLDDEMARRLAKRIDVVADYSERPSQNLTRKLIPPVNWLRFGVGTVDTESIGTGKVTADLRAGCPGT